MIDLLIRDGTVVDGTGRAPYAADVAVENGKIVEVGQLPEAHARRVISARGKLVTPGFIDIHRHADLAAYRPGFGQPELRQGLTTIVNGNCGLSAAPIRRSRRAEIAAYLQPICGQMPAAVSTDSLAAYFENQPDSPLHTGMLVGAGVLRAGAAGYALERLEEKHYKAIHKAMEQALGDGALGVSLGLGYAPECFYTTEELMRSLAPLAGQSIPVTVHMRQEGGGVLEALEEMLTVARKLRIPVHISHLKAMGRVCAASAHTRSHQPPEGHGPGQLGGKDPQGPFHAGAGPAGGPGGGLRCVPLHCRLHPAHPHPAPGFSHRRHRGGGAAAAGQGGSAGAGGAHPPGRRL